VRTFIRYIKKLVPLPIWNFFREIYLDVYFFFKDIGPYIRNRNYCGITLYYNRGNHLIQRLEREIVFEEKLCSSIVQNIEQKGDPTVIDIGANIGLISTYILSKIPTVKIFAFEPGPVQVAMLKKTVEGNHLGDRVTIYSYALGNNEGDVAFYTHKSRFIAYDGLLDTGRAKKPKKIDVRMTTLDSWWRSNNHPHVDAVKIDTEGAELLILKGAEDFITSVKPTIFLEIEPRNIQVYPYTHMDILQWLNERNYSLATLDNKVIAQDNFAEFIAKEDTFVARSISSR